MERIQEIYASDFQVSGQAPGTAENMEETMKQIFHELDESKKRIPLEQLEGYKLAMELEKRGIKMYRELAEKALGEKEKAFFEALAREEREHLTALDNVPFPRRYPPGMLKRRAASGWMIVNYGKSKGWKRRYSSLFCQLGTLLQHMPILPTNQKASGSPFHYKTYRRLAWAILLPVNVVAK